MKHIVNRLFSKLVLGALAIILQVGWLIYMVEYATQISNVCNYILHILSLLLALHIVNKDTRLYFKLSWVFFILCLPIAGCPCYFLFGRSELTRKKRKQLKEVYEQLAPNRREDPAVKERLKQQDEDAWLQSEYITRCAGYPLYEEEDAKYYSSGEALYADMLEDLKSAKSYIFMEYFILDPGEMLDTIVDLLEQKVKEGVHVRFIYDDVGSINNLPLHYSRTLQAKGIHCALFNPFRPFVSIIMNNRDHRKICAIDGKIAYTGGLNLADEYINKIERFGHWKDNGIRVTGQPAWSFAMMFLELWNYSVNSHEDCMKFCPEEYRKRTIELREAYEESDHRIEKTFDNNNEIVSGSSGSEAFGNRHKEVETAVKDAENGRNVTSDEKKQHGFVQPFSDSPLDHEYTSENVYLNIINRARKYVYIFTPYLITSEQLDTSLINAAKAGVDVRIVTPGIPDKKTAYLLTQSNYEHLIREGVKIYQYTPGFIHAKCIIADDLYAVTGTINLDYRSLYLHFECGVYMYNVSCLNEIKQDVIDTLAVCHEVSLEERQQKNFFLQLFLSVMRLLAPLF